ncbi:hypothetical protein OE88DRAFT_861116 [Heliocybe sulcata]|uniref:Wax synthase domain-containing protein n=1 Tax=Heliocybe sulcata TaxID=5364 RepID=A0A5C3MPH9_9AGAM|nr:hypothetical protein OE88DRAFT_861116 [Heliocybe sulcata]
MQVSYRNGSAIPHLLTLNQFPRPEFSGLRDFLFPAVCLALVISLRPGAAIGLVTFTVYCAMTLRALALTTGEPHRDFSTGTALASNIATAIHLLYLSDPVHQFRHEKDTMDPAALPMLKRWYWVLCLLHSPRGIGWSYRVAHTPCSPQQKRWHFVFLRLGRAIALFLIIDVAQTYIHSNPSFTHPTPYNSPFTSQGYLLRCVNIVAWLTVSHGTLNMNYTALSAACVAIGLSEPQDWPDLFGSWRESYTVRRYWGRTWHQLMRRYTSSIGKYCAQSLGFEKGTKRSSYTQLYAGFIVSALVHMGGDCMVGRQYVGSTFPFFIMQAVVITVEDVVIGLGKRTCVRCPLVVGYVWVFVWFMLSRAWYIQWAVDAGLGKEQPFKFSVMQVLLNYSDNARAVMHKHVL